MIPRGTWWLIIVMILGIGRATSGQGITLDPPAEGAFVLDAAEVISPEDEQAIRDIAAAVLAETRTPIIVVTIDSMTNHWPGGPVMIETFARILFDQWRIGHATIDGEVHNRGILVVVAVKDRKARIELGAGWGRGHDGAAATIMNAILVPAFRAGTYGDGLLRAVAALGDLARGRPTGEPAVTPRAPAGAGGGTGPRPISPSGNRSGGGGFGGGGFDGGGFGIGQALTGNCCCIGIILVIGFVASRAGRLTRGRSGPWIRSGSGRRGHRSFGGRSGGFFGGGSSGGGFSGGGGGSFGGGFSGGGGASGSW